MAPLFFSWHRHHVRKVSLLWFVFFKEGQHVVLNPFTLLGLVRCNHQNEPPPVPRADAQLFALIHVRLHKVQRQAISRREQLSHQALDPTTSTRPNTSSVMVPSVWRS